MSAAAWLQSGYNLGRAYTDEKSSWVRDVEAKALAWFTQD
jgi:hypothetical protein